MTTQPLPPPPDDDPARPGVPAVVCVGCGERRRAGQLHPECELPPDPRMTRREAVDDETDRGTG